MIFGRRVRIRSFFGKCCNFRAAPFLVGEWMLKPLITLAVICTATAAVSDVLSDWAKIQGVWRLAENSHASCVATPLVVDHEPAHNRLSASLRWTADPNLWGNLTLTILAAEGAVLRVRRDTDGALGVRTLSLDASSYRAAFDADNGAISTYLRCVDTGVNS